MRRKLDRFDRVYPETYDEHWGAISDTHARCVERVVQSVRPGGVVLDAACGTGRFFPMILAAGRRVHGVDMSSGMLARARAKHPQVPTEQRPLQDLHYEQAFDAVLCVDALENVPPEEWSGTIARLRAAAKPGARIYVTVEIPDPAVDLTANYEAGRRRGWPMVPGELAEDDGYHYYPARADVRRWLDHARVAITHEDDEDGYWHLQCQRIE